MAVRTFLTEPHPRKLPHAAAWRRLNETVRGKGGTSLGRNPYAGAPDFSAGEAAPLV